MAIIEAGLPLLVEKPIADTLAHVEEIIDASRARDTVLMCGLLERFNPAVRTAAEIARQPLHIATVRHSPYAERIRTGVASDLLIHDIDLVVRLMGEAPATLTGHYGYFEPRSTDEQRRCRRGHAALLRRADRFAVGLANRPAQDPLADDRRTRSPDRGRSAAPVDHDLPPRSGVRVRRRRRLHASRRSSRSRSFATRASRCSCSSPTS